MTTIAAIRNKKTKETVLCHDGRLTTTTHQLCSDKANKLIKFTYFALLWCGSEHMKTLLEHKHRKLFDNITIENEEDVLWFYQIYFDNVLNDPVAKAGDIGTERRHSADFIIVTPTDVYGINTLWEFTDADLSQTKYSDDLILYTNWSGWDVTRDYIEWYLHNTEIDEFTPEIMADILKAWAEYAGRRIVSCNSNITLYKARDLFL